MSFMDRALDFSDSRLQRRVKQALHFAAREFAMAAEFESGVGNVADLYTAQLHYRMPDRIEHAADLLVLALAQRDFKPGVARFACSLDQFDSGRGCSRFSETDPSSQSFDLLFAGRASHLHVIDLLDAAALRQELCQLAIVR